MSALGPLYFNTLKHPQALLLLIGVGLLLIAEIASRPSGILSISTGETLPAGFAKPPPRENVPDSRECGLRSSDKR